MRNIRNFVSLQWFSSTILLSWRLLLFSFACSIASIYHLICAVNLHWGFKREMVEKKRNSNYVWLKNCWVCFLVEWTVVSCTSTLKFWSENPLKCLVCVIFNRKKIPLEINRHTQKTATDERMSQNMVIICTAQEFATLQWSHTLAICATFVSLMITMSFFFNAVAILLLL